MHRISLFLIILFYSSQTFAMDNGHIAKNGNDECSNYIKEFTDKVTGVSFSKEIKLMFIPSDEKFNMALGFACDNEECHFIFKAAQNYNNLCIDKGDKVYFLFTDGSRMNISNDKDFNCKGTSSLSFGNEYQNIDKLIELSNKSIETIRITTADSYVEENLSPKQSEICRKTVKCLAGKLSNK